MKSNLVRSALIFFLLVLVIPDFTSKAEEKQEAAQTYKQNIDNLSATEWFERGYKLGISGNNSDYRMDMGCLRCKE